ncbi:MAG: class I tRNA ligase family protein, partial [Clostridia bacterium]|nr:class I tRNA ligase family protein [Clostridia bacterium]
DAFRLHVMFIGEYEQNTVWTFTGITGSVNFLNKVWDLQNIVKGEEETEKHSKLLHKLIKKINEGIYNAQAKTYEDTNDFRFNTLISAMMEFVNKVKEDGYISKAEYKALLIMLNPFAPHVTSEIYERVFGGDILDESFPVCDESKIVDTEVNLPVQLCGKMKGLLKVAVDTPKEEIEKMALELLGLTSAKKVIYVPNRIINIIA